MGVDSHGRRSNVWDVLYSVQGTRQVVRTGQYIRMERFRRLSGRAYG